MVAGDDGFAVGVPEKRASGDELIGGKHELRDAGVRLRVLVRFEQTFDRGKDRGLPGPLFFEGRVAIECRFWVGGDDERDALSRLRTSAENHGEELVFVIVEAAFAFEGKEKIAIPDVQKLGGDFT